MPTTTPYVGARSIEELAAALQKLSYTPRTEQQRRQQAEAFFQNQLNQELLNAQQKYDETDLALANQLASLGTSYDRQQRAIEKNTAQAVSAADRNALSRGMQRSSYNLTRMANLQNQGNQQLADMQQNRTDTENAIAEQRGLAARQLAQNTANARSQYEGSVLARMLEMEDQDYQRQLAADQFNSNTQLQLYSAQQADAQRAQQQAQFEAGQALTREQLAQNQNQFDLNLALQRDELGEKIRQFNEQMAFNREKLGGSGSGSGGSGGSGGTGATRATTNNPVVQNPRNYGNNNPIVASAQSTLDAIAAHGGVNANLNAAGKPTTLPAALAAQVGATTTTKKKTTTTGDARNTAGNSAKNINLRR